MAFKASKILFKVLGLINIGSSEKAPLNFAVLVFIQVTVVRREFPDGS